MRASVILPAGVIVLEALFGPAVTAMAQDAVDFGTFYTALAPYGEWVESPDYGWVWMPADVPAGWRPYTNGYWVYTDDYGWTWVSDYTWGWAPFHYGRWTIMDNFGWIWVPGMEWGPAWVSWRTGGEWLGWAPLPPGVEWREQGIIHDRDDIDSRIPWLGWCFVRTRDFDRRDVGRFAEMAARNENLFHQTRNITDIGLHNGRIFDRSLSPETIESDVGHRISRFRVLDENSPGATHISGENTLGMFRPAITARPPTVAMGKKAPAGGKGTAPLGRPQMPSAGRSVAPNAEPATPESRREFNRKSAAELRDLELKHSIERSRLDQLHATERSQPPEGISGEQLRTRQEAEREAQAEQHHVEMQQFHRMQERHIGGGEGRVPGKTFTGAPKGPGMSQQKGGRR